MYRKTQSLIAIAVLLIIATTSCKEKDKDEDVPFPTVKEAHPAEPEMVWVEGGTFTMGCTSEQDSSCWDDELPAHQVTLNDFDIGKYEITQKQWVLIMGTNPSTNKGDNLPVENVSWDEAQEFIRRLNDSASKQYRLPTEAEWEYAARGGNKSKKYKYSGGNDINAVAWYKDNSGGKSHAVGTKAANELGIYDMNGNVNEWCSDRYDAYSASPQTNPQGASSGLSFVYRGGCYSDRTDFCRITVRCFFHSSYTDNMGLRVVGL